MTPAERADLTESMHRSRHDQFPQDGYVGKVVKVGRKYAAAAYEVADGYYSGERTIEFDMETGRERGSTTNYGIYVRTPEQYDHDKRHSAAVTMLREHAIQLDFTRRKFTLGQLEAIVEVCKTFDTEG